MSDGIADRFNALDLARLALDVVVPLHHLFEQAAAEYHVLCRLGEHVKEGYLARKHAETEHMCSRSQLANT